MALSFDDYLPVIIAAVLSFGSALIILVLGRHMNLFDKTRQQSVLTTVNVSNVEEGLKEQKRLHDDLKQYFERKFEKMDEMYKDMFEKIDEEHTAEFRRIFDKLDDVDKKAYNLTWRVNELEGRKGTAGGAIH